MYLFDQHVIPDVRGRHVPIGFEEHGDPVTEGGEHLVRHRMTVINLVLKKQETHSLSTPSRSHPTHQPNLICFNCFIFCKILGNKNASTLMLLFKKISILVFALLKNNYIFYHNSIFSNLISYLNKK